MTNQGNIAKIDHLMSVERDLVAPDTGTTFRYLICSTARCGSTLVGEFLRGTRLAGDPLEYLNSRFIAGFLRSQSLPPSSHLDVVQYLATMERRRTTPNGYFGVKMHFEHLHTLFDKDLSKSLSFLLRFDRVLVLRRRDKLAQAVSLHRARVTQLWTSEDRHFLAANDSRLHRHVLFEPVAMARALYDIELQERGWDQILRRVNLPFHIFWYEDFVANNQVVGTDILSALGLSIPSLDQQLAPAISRQGCDDDPLLVSWRNYLGFHKSTKMSN